MTSGHLAQPFYPTLRLAECPKDRRVPGAGCPRGHPAPLDRGPIVGVLSQTRAGLFREGRTVADISCSVSKGALLTVETARRESGFESIASSIASPPMTSRRRPNERKAAAHPSRRTTR